MGRHSVCRELRGLANDFYCSLHMREESEQEQEREREKDKGEGQREMEKQAPCSD